MPIEKLIELRPTLRIQADYLAVEDSVPDLNRFRARGREISKAAVGDALAAYQPRLALVEVEKCTESVVLELVDPRVIERLTSAAEFER